MSVEFKMDPMLDWGKSISGECVLISLVTSLYPI